MNEFLTTDNIAIYGAIVATLAMLITLWQLYNSIQDKKVQLRVSYKKHPKYDDNLKMLGIPYNPMTGEGGGNIAELYTVIIRNIGNVDAFISEIYGISQDGSRHDVLVRGNTNLSVMAKISQNKIEQIPTKSPKDYSIYFNNKSKSYVLKKCIVIDGTGKEWKAKLSD